MSQSLEDLVQLIVVGKFRRFKHCPFLQWSIGSIWLRPIEFCGQQGAKEWWTKLWHGAEVIKFWVSAEWSHMLCHGVTGRNVFIGVFISAGHSWRCSVIQNLRKAIVFLCWVVEMVLLLFGAGNFWTWITLYWTIDYDLMGRMTGSASEEFRVSGYLCVYTIVKVGG